MHEFSIMREVVSLVSEKCQGRAVQRVTLEVGRLSGVLTDALHFCWEPCTEDTPLAGAVLEIEEPPGRARCRECGMVSEFSEPYGQCECGDIKLEWLSGSELLIRQVEFD